MTTVLASLAQAPFVWVLVGLAIATCLGAVVRRG